MKQIQAVEHLREMLWAVQRARSMITETFGDLGEDFLITLHPWLFGPKCVLPSLVTTVGEVETGGELTPQRFYNLMWITDKELAINTALFATNRKPLPEPDINWIVEGWEE